MVDRATPNLPARDLDATLAFYAPFGFEVVFRDAGWMILRRNGLQLEFFPFPGLVPTRSDAMCCLRVADLDGLYAQILASGVPEARTGFPRLHPVTRQPWGQRAGALIDLDGTQLTLIEDRDG